MFESSGSVIGIATAYGMDNRKFGVPVPVGSRMLISPHRPDLLCSPHNLLSNGYWRALTQRINLHELEADH
jgi:hypothetical protein